MKVDHSKIYAFVCPQEGHGILSWGDDVRTQKPLTFMSKETADKLMPLVKRQFTGHGLSVELREYTFSKVLEKVC